MFVKVDLCFRMYNHRHVNVVYVYAVRKYYIYEKYSVLSMYILYLNCIYFMFVNVYWMD